MLAAIAVFAYLTIDDLIGRAQMVDDTREVIARLHKAKAVAMDAVLGQRAYLLRSEQQYLDLFQTSAKALPGHMDRLAAVLNRDPEQRRRFEELQVLFADMLTAARASLQPTINGSMADIAVPPALSRPILDRIRALFRQMENAERRRLKGRIREAEALADTTRITMVTGYAIGLTILLVTFWILFREVKRRFRAEAHLRRVNARLESTNRELETFSYSASHDLRTPLRAINGFSHILMKEYGERLDDEGRRLLHKLQHNSQQMGQLIDDLLAFVRLGRTDFTGTKVDMTTLVQEVYDEIQPSSPADPGIRFMLSPLPSAWGDRALLHQVWTNLLTNAIKYSSERDDPLIEVSGEVVDDEIQYHIRDNGIGFDMRYYDKLFDMFQRLHGDERFMGTGIGLAIVKRIISRHHGRVWAEGIPDVGATFHFALPKKGG